MRYHDNNGLPFDIESGREENIERLMEMYAGFHPRGQYQGLPPKSAHACFCWIAHLFNIGENFLALRAERIVGHAALLPDPALQDGEYLVFMHQDHRGQGMGTALTRFAIERARTMGLAEMWLTVDRDNFIAIRLYRKCGFQFCDETSFEGERKMILPIMTDPISPAVV